MQDDQTMKVCSYLVAAYLLWGLFPLYFHALQDVSALEILAHRIVWSLVVTAAILMALRRGEPPTSTPAK